MPARTPRATRQPNVLPVLPPASAVLRTAVRSTIRYRRSPYPPSHLSPCPPTATPATLSGATAGVTATTARPRWRQSVWDDRSPQYDWNDDSDSDDLARHGEDDPHATR